VSGLTSPRKHMPRKHFALTLVFQVVGAENYSPLVAV
jgi:hypothetical protein